MNLLNLTGFRRLPVVMQSEHSECGLACLTMILHWYGRCLPLSMVRATASQGQRGTSLRSLMQVAGKHGMHTRPLRLECKELRKLSLPAILHWHMDHFVVLVSCKRKTAVIHDPALGRRRIDWQEIDRNFTGVALELSPTPAFTRHKPVPELKLRDLWSGSSGLAGSLVQLFLLSALLQVFSLGLPFYSQLFIDEVLVNSDFALLKVLAVGFFLITVVKSFTELLRAWSVLYLSNSLSFRFAANVFRHLLHLPLNYFSGRHMGDIVSRFGSLGKLRDFLSSGIVEILIDGIMVCGTLTIMFVYSRLLTWVALAAVVVYAVVRLTMHNSYWQRSEKAIMATAQENTRFMENVRAIQGVKLFGREQDRLNDWQGYYADVVNAGAAVQRLGIGIRFISGLLVGVENIILMLLGGYAVLNQQLSMGMIIAYISFKDQFYSRVFALIDKLFEFRLLRLHLERLADIVHTRPEDQRHGIGMPRRDVCLEGGLRLEKVSFRYSSDSDWLFRGINLQVDAEESVAITGPTGCGKSTLLRLILSLQTPGEGQVSFHGVPICSIGLEAYRERIAGVMQDDCLLSGSILENITFFDPEPDRERVELVCHLAAITRDIRAMPMQYDTLVGNMGSALSGGQVQRLLIARALYKQPSLLVLDEATSHLDLDTERSVNQAIRQMNIARIMVAHRPQTILQADRILRLDNDALTELSRQDIRSSMHTAGHNDNRPPASVTARDAALITI